MLWVLSMLVQNEWVKTRRALRERQPAAGDEVSEAADARDDRREQVDGASSA